MNAGTWPNNATDRAADYVESPRESERVGVVIGSTRPTRICPGIGRVDPGHSAGAECSALIDLAEVDLPFLDEPLKASLREYEHQHARAWSRLISSYSGFVFVFPQYNWGYPAPLKNALDFLYYEWHDAQLVEALTDTQ